MNTSANLIIRQAQDSKCMMVRASILLSSQVCLRRILLGSASFLHARRAQFVHVLNQPSQFLLQTPRANHSYSNDGLWLVFFPRIPRHMIWYSWRFRVHWRGDTSKLPLRKSLSSSHRSGAPRQVSNCRETGLWSHFNCLDRPWSAVHFSFCNIKSTDCRGLSVMLL